MSDSIYWFTPDGNIFGYIAQDTTWFYTEGGEPIGYREGNWIHAPDGAPIGYFDNEEKWLFKPDGTPLAYRQL